MPLTERQKSRKAWLEQAVNEIQNAQINGFKSGFSMSFNGRSIQRFSPKELENLRHMYDRELIRLEKIEAGNYTRTVRVNG